MKWQGSTGVHRTLFLLFILGLLRIHFLFGLLRCRRSFLFGFLASLAGLLTAGGLLGLARCGSLLLAGRGLRCGKLQLGPSLGRFSRLYENGFSASSSIAFHNLRYRHPSKLTFSSPSVSASFLRFLELLDFFAPSPASSMSTSSSSMISILLRLFFLASFSAFAAAFAAA